MKRISFVCIAILLFCSTGAFAAPAAVIDGFECNAAVPNEDGGFEPFNPIVTTDSHKVITSSGVAVITCHFEHDVLLAHATGAEGFLCAIVDAGIADESRLVATPGGKALMVCKINNN